MIYIAWAIVNCAGITAACYLIMHDCPWWAAAILICAFNIEVKDLRIKKD